MNCAAQCRSMRLHIVAACLLIATAMLPSPALADAEVPAGAGVRSGGNAAGSFAWACFGDALGTKLGSGCAAAMAFASSVEETFLGWDFSYSAGFAACGGVIAVDNGVTPHVGCDGTVNGDEGPGFDCSALGPIVGPFYTSCSGSSIEVSDDECAAANAEGDSTAIPGIRTVAAVAGGWSAGCGTSLAFDALENMNPVGLGQAPEEVIDQVRKKVHETINRFFEEEIDLKNVPNDVKAIVDQMRINLLEQADDDLDGTILMGQPIE